MAFMIDMRVLELLASRLCHDIVGPVGAVNNGMEMLEDDEFDMAEEAMKLASVSARQAAHALQFYRMAYGMAGDRVGGDLSELRKLAGQALEKSKVTLEWQEIQTPEGAPDGFGKLTLNLLDLASESLPRGGRLDLAYDLQDGAFVIRALASGQGCTLRGDTADGLDPNVKIEDLTPRNIQGYFTRLLTQRLGGGLTVETPGPDSMAFIASVASAS